MSPRLPYYLSVLVLLFQYELSAQSTGKIAGRVTDESTGEPLVGANIIVTGTTHGASTDEEGWYDIIKVPSGVYEVTVAYLGYQKQVVQGVKVLTDLTTRIDVRMTETTIAGAG